MNQQNHAILIVAAFVPFLFFFQALPNYRNPNELSRFLLVSAIVDDGTFQIDAALKKYGPCQDVSYYGGHYYTNKAIGYSLLAVPFYFLIVHSLGITDYDAVLYILKIFVNLIPLLFFSALLFRCLRDRLNLGTRRYILLAAFFFGTLIFPYTQMFASHMLTGLLWFAAFYLVVFNQGKWMAFTAGALLGYSFVMEVPSLLMIPLFLIWIFFHRRSLFIPFAAGCALFSLPALLYNITVFDGPLNWSYKYVSTPELKAVHEQGYVGEGAPSLSVLWQLTFGSNRGFFYFQPHLLLGAAGFIASWRQRKECWLAAAVVIVNLLFYSGYASWDGGWSFGPRFLVPLVPFFIYGCGLWFERRGETESRSVAVYVYLAFLGWAIAGMLMGSATFLLSPRFLSYILQWEVPALFWGGFFGLNWGDLFGLPDIAVQLMAILLVCVPLILFLWKAQIDRPQWATILASLFLFLFGSGLLMPLIRAQMPPAHAIAIGRIGYFQGQYGKALEYLHQARSRTTHPALLQEADRWIALCDQKIEEFHHKGTESTKQE